MSIEDPLIRIEHALRETLESESNVQALEERELAIRELQYIHHRIMVEVDKVAAAQQQSGGELHALIDTVERIVSSEPKDNC